MNYTFVSYNALTRIAVIQVRECILFTEISIPEGMVQDSPEWNQLMDDVTNDVMANMDPMSPTYDPSLTAH